MTEQLQFMERKRKAGLTDAEDHMLVIEKRLTNRKSISVAESNRLGAVIEKSEPPA